MVEVNQLRSRGLAFGLTAQLRPTVLPRVIVNAKVAWGLALSSANILDIVRQFRGSRNPLFRPLVALASSLNFYMDNVQMPLLTQRPT